MIKLHNITKSFGELQVLKDISLTIKNGEIVSIIGPSGAGKTTLLQIMGTLERPDSGSVTYNDSDITNYSEEMLSHFRNRHIGFVFQFHQLLPEFTAEENVMIPAMIAGDSAKDAQKRATELLRMLEIDNRAHHKPSQLSGGEKQRIAVARALINNPYIVLADEPSGSLDSHNREELYNLFFDLRDRLNQTFVIITHDERLSQITDRSIYLSDGVIKQQ